MADTACRWHGKSDDFKTGDRVQVVKAGKQLGKTAVVADTAMGGGRIKVEMEGEMVLKSYAPDDLKIIPVLYLCTSALLYLCTSALFVSRYCTCILVHCLLPGIVLVY